MKCREYRCWSNGVYFVVIGDGPIDEQIQDKEGRCLKHARELYRTKCMCFPNDRIAVYQVVLEWSSDKQFSL